VPDPTGVAVERIIAGFEQIVARCTNGLLRRTELGKALREIEESLRVALIPDSDAFRVFDPRRQEVDRWRDDDAGEYANWRECRRAEQWLSIARDTLAVLQPAFLGSSPDKTQFLLQAGAVYEAKARVFSVMRRATLSLDIVDAYMDDEVVPYVESLEHSVAVRLLTHDKKPIFPVLLKALQAKRPRLESRQSRNFHDRFIVVDKAEVWQLGSSLNRIGSKTVMLNKVVEDAERAKFLAEFEHEWLAGVPI
jgi:hypothetical protein